MPLYDVEFSNGATFQAHDQEALEQALKGVEFEEVVPDENQLLNLPVAGLQIVQSCDILESTWLDRAMIDPILSQNADGLWTLSVYRQGEYGEFEMPYISSEIILADAELGLIVVLISYHGTDAYGPKRDRRVQKGQFYRYYRQLPTSSWEQIPWRLINDDLRTLIIETVEESGPPWAKRPGKLQAERNPPAKPVTMTSYKVVRLIDGRFWSLYDPTQEYVIGERLKQTAKPHHGGGYFSYPTLEMGTDYLASCVRFIPFHAEVETPEVALLECEIGGRVINYGHKMASTYLCPVRVLQVMCVEE